jgi:hypothetical protein
LLLVLCRRIRWITESSTPKRDLRDPEDRPMLPAALALGYPI